MPAFFCKSFNKSSSLPPPNLSSTLLPTFLTVSTIPSSTPPNERSTCLIQPLTSLEPISSVSPTKSATSSIACVTATGPNFFNRSGRCISILRVIALATGLSSILSGIPCGLDDCVSDSSKSSESKLSSSVFSLCANVSAPGASVKLSAHSANAPTSFISATFLCSLLSIGITLSMRGSNVSCTNNSFRLLVSVSSSINDGVQLSK